MRSKLASCSDMRLFPDSLQRVVFDVSKKELLMGLG